MKMQNKHQIKVSVIATIIAALLALHSPTVSAQTSPAPTKPAPLTGTWTIDPAHTSVTFAISHLGISQVHGRFDTVSGTIVADAQHPANSSVQFTIQVASINTDMPYRDADLKSNKYFDAADYPTITFQSTKIVKSSEGFVAVGDLTIHGIARQVSLPFQLEGPILDPFGSSRIGIVTQAVVSRLDYKVGGNDTIMDGSFAIGKDATVDISLEATPAKAG
jgi:polyisoprenoid-binding protein YceI